MILKKPYAFLIKNFKIIHIILSVLIFSIIIMFGNVSNFFSEYVKGEILGSLGLSASYINPTLYLIILIVIIFALVMFLLMRNKDKPTLFYITLFIYYLTLLIMVFISLGIMNSLEEATLTQQASRAYRDIYLIISLPQYYFLIMSTIRGIGFDVKKFNFNKDLEELEIKSEDNEEFEFVLGTDTYKQIRKIRRIIRELKYYVLENKLIFTVISTVVIILIIISVIINFNFLNKVYKVGSTGTIGNLKYELKNAYETKYDYNGKEISKGKKYVILDMVITNQTMRSQSIDNISLYLKAGSESVYNSPSLRNYFIDFGKAYINNQIKENSTNKYIFVFELDDNISYKNYHLNVLKSIETNKGITEYKYTKFKIKTNKLDINRKKIERKINEVMYLGENIFADTNIIIKNAEIKNSYEYKYESCTLDNCSEFTGIVAPDNPANNSLLILNYKLDINNNIGLKETATNNKYFFDNFLKIEYNYNNKKVIRSANAKTYPNLNNLVFVEIPKTATKSELLNILISTRNNQYYINYKSI